MTDRPEPAIAGDPASLGARTQRDRVAETYRQMEDRLDTVRTQTPRPLTLTEKILRGHAEDPLAGGRLALRPDRLAMQDATAQMALLQFMLTDENQAQLPTTVHTDHLVVAREGADPDLSRALQEHQEVYEFLEDASRAVGIGFWEPGSGIIHQIVLEQYAFPGGLILGTDSHTPNAGGLGMLGVGVGGAEAALVMAGEPWRAPEPDVVGIHLVGELGDWTTPKDVILRVLDELGTEGGTGAVLEYFGAGAEALSATGKATIANMGAETGATGTVFPYDEAMAAYLSGTERADVAGLAEDRRDLLCPDPGIVEDPDRHYDRVVEIDLDALEPQVAGPHSPDRVRSVSQTADAVYEEGYVDRLSAAILGSCTNSSYQDLSEAAAVARQARRAGLTVQTPLLVAPGSARIEAAAERDGLLDDLRAIGGRVLANACGPCVGRWDRPEVDEDSRNAIITSFNRNFPGRNDGRQTTQAHLASPAMIVAYALAGRLSFDPLSEPIPHDTGRTWLTAPARAPVLPDDGLVAPEGYHPPSAGDAGPVEVPDDSDRLEPLEPFDPWDGEDLERLPLLVKVKGQCTTDQISPAGPWIRYRGHLDRISDNLLRGATNAFTGEVGTGRHLRTDERDVPLADIARDYREHGQEWAVVGDRNYGEGSSREHAAMSPRHLGCRVVLARSFARIHETNLKMQGILPLTFADPSRYEDVRERDRISVIGLESLAPGRTVRVKLLHADGSTEDLAADHTMSHEEIRWFEAGSAINALHAGR